MMKNQIKLAALMVAAAVIIFVGCVSQNPDKTPDPTTGKPPPANIVDPRLSAASNTVAGVAAATAPVNPFDGIVEYAIKIGFGLAGLISGWLVQKRNTAAAQAQVAEKQTILSAVIQGVEASGPAAAPIKDAIQARATAAGVQPQLDAAVQSLT